MANQYFNARYGITTGNITLDAAPGNITANNANIGNKLTVNNFALVGNLVSNIIPNANVTYQIGNAAFELLTVYSSNINLSGNINLGAQTISSNNDGVILSNTVFANAANIGNANISNLSVNNQLTINSSINSTSTDSGSLVTKGGAGVEKDLYVGGAIHLANNNGGTTSKVYLAYNELASGLDINFNS